MDANWSEVLSGAENPILQPVYSPHILIVDDDFNTRLLLKTIVERAGYKVTLAEDGKEAWAKLLETFPGGESDWNNLPPDHGFDLLLSDWNMPELNGEELVRRLREHPRLRLVFAILVTAKKESEGVISGLDSGADDYVTKPFQPLELLARIKAGLRIRRLQSELASLQHKMAAVHLATAACHEINNPLMVLMGHIEMLRKRLEIQGDAENMRRIGPITEALDRIQRVTQALGRLKQVKLKNYLPRYQMVDLGLERPPGANQPSGISGVRPASTPPVLHADRPF